VIGGMLGATGVAVFFIPMFFFLLESVNERRAGKKNAGAIPERQGGGSVADSPSLANRSTGMDPGTKRGH
jgi:multidrug efflux pump